MELLSLIVGIILLGVAFFGRAHTDVRDDNRLEKITRFKL